VAKIVWEFQGILKGLKQAWVIGHPVCVQQKNTGGVLGKSGLQLIK
jgi:hypothetical protein